MDCSLLTLSHLCAADTVHLLQKWCNYAVMQCLQITAPLIPIDSSEVFFFFLFFFCFALAPVPLCSEKQPGLEQRSLGSLVPRNTPGLVRAQPSDLYKLTVLEVQINVVSGKAQFKLEPCCFLKSYHVHRNPTPLSGRTHLFLFNIKITLQDLEKKKRKYHFKWIIYHGTNT